METNKGTQTPQQGGTAGRQENEQTQQQSGTGRQNERQQSGEELNEETTRGTDAGSAM